MLKNKLSMGLLTGAALLAGALGGTALLASAQTTTTPTTQAVTSSTNSTQGAVDTPENANDPADTGSEAQHHAPLGGDGVVSSISGTTIVVGKESNEGGASYTVDASKATVTNNGAAASLSDIKVGDKIFVQGTVTGTNVAATSVSLGHPGWNKESGNDSDGGAQSEASEPAGSTDSGE